MDEIKESRPAPTQSRLRTVSGAMVLIALSLISFLAGVFCFVRFALDGRGLAHLIIPHLEHATGTVCRISGAQLSWSSLDRGTIALNDLTISTKGDSAPLLEVPMVVVEMSVRPLLRGRLLIHRAALSQPRIVLPEELGQVRMTASGDLAAGSRLWLYPFIQSLEVYDGCVVARGAGGAPSPDRPLFSRIQVRAEDVSPTGVASLACKGLVVRNGQAGSLELTGSYGRTASRGGEPEASLSGRLVDCPILPFLDLAGRLFGFHVPITGGTVDLSVQLDGSLRRVTVQGDLKLSSAVLQRGELFPKTATVDHGRMRFTVKRDHETVDLEVMDFSVPGAHLAGQVRAERIASASPDLTVVLKETSVDLATCFPLIPLNLLAKEDRDRLSDAGLKGRIRITGGLWKGTTADLFGGGIPAGSFQLDATLDRVAGFVPGVGAPISGAAGQVRLSSDEVHFNGISLTVGASAIVLNGGITHLRDSPQGNLFVSITAQAQDFKPLLQNRFTASYVQDWMGWIVDPAGGLAVTLDMKGDLRSPVMKGRITLEEFQCGIKDFALPLKKVNGAVRFRGTGVTFSQLKGMLGESPVTVQGHVAQENLEINGEMKLSPGDVKKLGGLPAGLTMSRPAPITLTVKGKPTALTFSLLADFKPVGLTDERFIRKQIGVPLVLEASGARTPTELTVDEGYLLLGENRIALRAAVKDDGKTIVSCNLPPRGILTDALVPFAHPALELQPGGRIEGDVVIRMDKSRKTATETNFSFTHVSLRIPGMYKRTDGLTAVLRQRPRSLQISIERGRTGSSQFHGTISISDLDNPRLEAHIEWPFMDTADYTAPPGYKSPVTWGEWIRSSPVIRFLARCRGTGFVRVHRGKTAARMFSDFRANLEASPGTIRVPSWQVEFAEGIGRGTGLFDLHMDTERPFTLDFQFDDLKMERLMQADPEWFRISGKVVLLGKLEWRLGTNPENNGMYKTGTVEFRMREGVINRFDILTKVFSLINLGSILRGSLPDIMIQGLPFQQLTSTMSVVDTKWKIKDLKLLSDAARVDATGMYFGDQDRIDCKVHISPLVGLDKIFSEIFGNTLTKNGKILTTTFRVRGLYTSPDVRLEPFDNLKSGE